MPEINPAALELGFRLGLGDIGQHPPCHGFRCGCVCDECRERIELGRRPKKAVKQPWELEAA